MEYHLGAPTNTTEEVQMTQGNYRRKSGTCQKSTYRTRDLAEEAAAHMMSGKRVFLPEQAPLTTYWCNRHSGWHFGHSDWKEIADKAYNHRAKQIREGRA